MEEQMKKFDQINRDLRGEISAIYEKLNRIKMVVDRLDGGVPEAKNPNDERTAAEPFSIIDQQTALIGSICEINSILQGLSVRLENIA